MKFPCIDLSVIKIPKSINDRGEVEFSFNGCKYKFQYSLKDYCSRGFLLRTHEFESILDLGYINKVDNNNEYIKNWGIFLQSTQINKVLVEYGKELSGFYLSDVCGEILIISGWQEFEYKLLIIPFNK